MRFGKYEVLEGIGEGGFGRVYKGWDPVLKRPVAIKTCTWDDPGFRRRFVREAEVAGGLRHPNIVTVHDFGEERGEPYLVQEFLEGEDLDDLIARGEPRDLETKIALLRQVAEGLGYAHDSGIVHRDVKPSNVRVGSDGRVSIMDFGIAKLLSADSGLTQTGMSIGTAGYSSPEQLEGREVDARSDVFSFGVVAYELIAGRRPFRGDTVSSLLYQIVNVDPAPLAEVRPDCPGALGRLVDRCLEKDPSARYASFPDVLRDLERLTGDSERIAAGVGAGPGRGEPTRARSDDVAATRVARSDDVAPTRVARADESPGSDDGRARSTPRRAYVGLLVAAAAVAMFGILNLVRSSRSTPVGFPDDFGEVIEAPGYEEDTGGDSPEDGPGGDTRPDGTAGADGAEETEDEAGTDGVQDTDDSDRSGEPVEDDDGARDETSPDRDPDPPDDGGADPAVPHLRGVMVVVYGAEPAFYRAAENVMLSRLTDAGHEVFDEVSAEMRADVAESGAGLGDLGRAAGAAVLVVGELRTDAVASVGGMFTGSAALSVRAYDVAAGRLLTSETYLVGVGDVPGKLGGTPDVARTEAATQVGHQAAAALRARLAAGP